MGAASFDELYRKLCTGDESVEIEAKRAEELGKSIQTTISAFANEPDRGGGHILLGVGADAGNLFSDYEVLGVGDVDKVQADLASTCRTVFSVPIRPEITVEQHQGRNVVVVYIPESDPHDKPVYIKRKGVHDGTYRRIGSTDHVCTDNDLAMLYQARTQRSPDETPVAQSSLDDVEPRAVAEYRHLRESMGRESKLLSYSDADLLRALGATAQERGETVLTVAGLLLFGKADALRRLLPMTRIDYVRVEGREWVPDPDHRYQSSIEKLGPLLLTIPALVAQILDDIPKAFMLSEDGIHRKDVPVIPRNVIREAVVNATMHRCYQQRQPSQIIRYANRIEIRNPGYSLVPEERLGEPGSKTRNAKVAAVLHDVGLAETKGTGIRAMRQAMERANLTQPLLESDRAKNEFTVRLLVMHLLGPEDWRWLSRFKDCDLSDDDARALIVAREIGAVDNSVFRSVAHVDTLTASSRLRRLRDAELLEQRGKGSATYYVPTAKLLGPPTAAGLAPGLASEPPGKRSPIDNGLSVGLNPADKALSMGLGSLPADLAEAVETLGRRASPTQVEIAILGLCNWRSLQPSQLAGILERDQAYLLSQYLRPMIQAGRLEYLHADNPAHPRQAYKTPEPISAERERKDP